MLCLLLSVFLLVAGVFQFRQVLYLIVALVCQDHVLHLQLLVVGNRLLVVHVICVRGKLGVVVLEVLVLPPQNINL